MSLNTWDSNIDKTNLNFIKQKNNENLNKIKSKTFTNLHAVELKK